jgi:universal stress protein E
MESMQPVKSILVDVDATAAVHPAMTRAVNLARACGARIKLVDVVNIPADARRYLSPDAEETLISSRRLQLERLASEAKDCAAEAEILAGRPAIALIQEVIRSGHDLLVRSHARDLVAPHPKMFGAIDMQLFRECPCPVWAIGPGGGAPARRVLAGVHAVQDETDPLNKKIIEHAIWLGRLEVASLTVLQVWSAFGEEVLRHHYSAEDLTAYVDAAESTARTDLETLTASFGDRLKGVEIALRKGQPEDVIPQFVVSQGIDVVVMGTVARTGIAGLLIGNTAERLLQRMPCSVFAVKPDAFVCPVRLDTRA